MLFPFIQKINKKITVNHLLAIFWSSFWLLNGFDKFFNGEYFFGVTRDEKFIAYFSSIGMQADIALSLLYSCGVCEILIGVAFLWSFKNITHRKEILEFCLKAGMSVFIIFSVFDILFGDRTELWEHSTFLILLIVSYAFLQIMSKLQTMNTEHVLPHQNIPSKS